MTSHRETLKGEMTPREKIIVGNGFGFWSEGRSTTTHFSFGEGLFATTEEGKLFGFFYGLIRIISLQRLKRNKN